MLDAQAQALLDLLTSRNVAPFYSLAAASARQLYRERRGLTQPDAEEVEHVQHHTLDVPATSETAAAQIQLREYQPKRLATIQAPSPALVYYHGGGWTIGDLETHDVLCRSLANRSGCVVFAVDYRLGPEHQFPAAFHDAVAAFNWVSQQAGPLGIDPKRIAVGGDSAGGNLAAAVSLALRQTTQTDSAKNSPAYQLLIYPATDLRAVAPSHTTNGSGFLLDNLTIQWFTQNYLTKPEDANDWRASPALATAFKGLPPALVLTAGYDPLRDEGREYADALTRAGVACEYICFERQIHGFITMGRILRESHTAIDLCAAALRRALA